MGEEILVISDLNFRHKVRKPRWNKPWATMPGPGLVNLSLKIKPGKIIGLVGPNGAGKTTLLEAIAGLHIPESGTIKINNEISTSVNSRTCVGFMPESVTWRGLGTPRKWLHRLSVMRGCENTVDDLLQTVGLGDRADHSLDSLSKGMRQRLSLAASLIGMPELLLLDEPLNGLDPVAQEALKSLLNNLVKNGKCVIVSSHLLAEIELFVDYVVILHKGSIAIEGSLKDIENDLNLGGILVIKGSKSNKNKILAALSSLNFKENIDFDLEDSASGWELQLQHTDGKWKEGEREEVVEVLVSNNCTPNSIELLDCNLTEILNAVTGIERIDMQIQGDNI